jgi:hypothetical protein
MDAPTLDYLLAETRAAFAAVAEVGRLQPFPGTPRWDHWQTLIAQANELNAALGQLTSDRNEESFALCAW